MTAISNLSDVMTSIASFLAVVFMFYKVTKRVRCPCCEIETRDPDRASDPVTPKSPGVIQIMLDKLTPRSKRNKRKEVESADNDVTTMPSQSAVEMPPRRKKGVTIGDVVVV